MERVRPAWWHEVLLVAVTYGLYTLTRNTLPMHTARARANALQLYDFERHLHLDVELGLNRRLAASSLSHLADYAYAVPHLTVTVGVLVWVFLRHPASYVAARTALLVTTVAALVGFWLYPLSPPRFFPGLGFVDTVVRDGTWGSWGDNRLADLSNEHAAMPSIHVAWALWCAVTVALLVRRRWVRAVAALYPVLVVVVVMSTGNHWALDVLGGAAVACLGALGAQLTRRRQRAASRPRRASTSPASPG